MADGDDNTYDDSSATATDTNSTIPDTDVDGLAAKRHGDYFMDVNEPQRAVEYYQEALNKGDLDATDTEKVYYNMASAYYRLGDQQNCYNASYYAAKSQDPQVAGYALKFFFWSVTGEKVVGTD